MFSTSKQHVNVLIFLYVVSRIVVGENKDSRSDILVSASLIPKVAFTKTTKLKVSLLLNKYPPAGTIVNAVCNLQTLANFSLGIDVPQEVLQNFDDHSETLTVKNTGYNETSVDKTEDNPLLPFVTRDVVLDTQSWTLPTTYFSFNEKFSAQDLIVTRGDFPTVHKVELLLLHCTLSVSGLTTLQRRVRVTDTSAVLVTDLSPSVIINWTETPAQGIAIHDRKYQNPAYADISRCPCDLDASSCDVNCCCDPNCRSTDLKLFECLKGLQGGFSTPKFAAHSCGSRANILDDWFPFVCLVRHNSPYLGLIYLNSPPIFREQKSLRAFINDEIENKKLWDDISSGNQVPDSSSYKYGSSILTINEDTEEVGYLSLPARILTGQCIESSPIPFLIPRITSCNFLVMPDTCTQDSLLSYTMYLSDMSGDMQVLARSDMLETASLSTSYVCVNSTADYTEETDSSHPSQCPTGDLAPVYHADLQMCENAVLGVTYSFWWSGPEIRSVNVSVTLGNVSLISRGNSAPASRVTQKFQTRYFHAVDNETDSIINITDVLRTSEGAMSQPIVRSGNPGYDIGRLLITGVPKSEDGNVTVNVSDFSYMDIGPSSSIRLVRSANSCGSFSEPIVFGVNSYSGCKLDVPGGVRNSCLLLNYLVLKNLCRLIPSTYVSRGGNPSVSKMADFILIIREDPCLHLGEAPRNDNATTIMEPCDQVPSHLEVVIFHSVAGEFNGFPFHQISGMRTRFLNTTWTRCRSPETDLNGGCWNPTFQNGTSSTFITSSVEFVEIPSNLYPSTKRFWLIQNSGPCYRDSCWSELASPFTHSEQGDVRSYVVKWGLVLLALGTITLCLTKSSW